MNILENLNGINSKLDTINNIFRDIEKAVDTLTGTTGTSIKDVPNIIYNYNAEDINKKDFILYDLEDIPTGTGISGFKAKVSYLESVKVSILNALRTRFIEINDSTEFGLYDTYIETLSNIGGDDRLELLSIKSVPGSEYYTTKLTIDVPEEYQGKPIYYTISNMIPLPSMGNIYEEYNELSTEEIYIDNNTSIVVFVKDDETGEILISGMVVCKTKMPIEPVKINISSNPGAEYKSSILTMIPELVSGHKYYYRKFNQEITDYKGDPISLEGYTEYDPDDTFIGESAVYTFIEVDENGCLYGLAETYIMSREYAIKYKISTTVAEEGESVYIVNNNTQVEGSEYYYCIGEDIPLSEQEVDETKYLAWTPETIIEVSEGEIVTLVEVLNGGIVKYGNCVVLYEQKEINILSISSIAGEENGYTTLILPESGNDFYYKESYSYSYPLYGELVSDDYTLIENRTMVISPNSRLLVVEAKERMIIGAGYCIITVKTPMLETILLKSEPGEYTGYTKLSVIENFLDDTNKYVYKIGNVTTAYNKDLTDWKDWNAVDEIYCGLDETIITVAEVTSSYRARKIGAITANVRPVELTELILTSRRGTNGGCTYISVSPRIMSGNTYKYKIGEKEDVVLYQDVSSWKDWDGYSEIESEDGVIINIAECIEGNKVLKIGNTIVRAKAPDPVLEPLTVTSEQGSNIGCTFITVTPSLTDGYQYAYKFTSDIPQYHDSAADWSAWDGISEIKAEAGVIICIAECTTDGFITKAGIAICHSK